MAWSIVLVGVTLVCVLISIIIRIDGCEKDCEMVKGIAAELIDEIDRSCELFSYCDTKTPLLFGSGGGGYTS